MQVLSNVQSQNIFVLCVVLLFVVIAQGKRLDELSQKIDGKADSLRYELQGEISNITNIVRSELEELDRIVLRSELKPRC